MINVRIIRQLRSKNNQARKEALTYLSRNLPNDELQAEVLFAVLELCKQDSGFCNELLEVVVRLPSVEMLPYYMKIFASTEILYIVRALESIPLWVDVEFGIKDNLSLVVAKLTKHCEPWIAFLSSIEGMRHLGFGEEYWKQAAKAVVRADGMEWWKSIRSQAQELLGIEEAKLIDMELALLNAKPIAPDNEDLLPLFSQIRDERK